MCSGERSSSAKGAIALRASGADGWSTSRRSVLSDWTMRGPSFTSRFYGRWPHARASMPPPHRAGGDDRWTTRTWTARLRSSWPTPRRPPACPPTGGISPRPSAPEEELEDAPPPPRLRIRHDDRRSCCPTARRCGCPTGRTVVVERVVAPPVVTPHGLVCAFDPLSYEWQGVSLTIQLRGDVQPVEVAVLRHETPRGVEAHGAVAVIGDVSKVKQWVELPSATRLSVDKGCGAFVAQRPGRGGRRHRRRHAVALRPGRRGAGRGGRRRRRRLLRPR